MDYQAQFNSPDRTAGLMNAALIAGIIGIICSPIPMLGMIAPSLAIMFALLSRGNQMHTCSKAKAGLVMGIIGVIISIVTTIAIFSFAFSSMSSEDMMEFYEEFYEEYYEYPEFDSQEPFDL